MLGTIALINRVVCTIPPILLDRLYEPFYQGFRLRTRLAQIKGTPVDNQSKIIDIEKSINN